ncbi:MAG: 3-dehydroquinate synthase [Deltaproteobacteria bacterium]|nr:3-dehydroquinate synthase [Deltaproteobacteria bacterium]
MARTLWLVGMMGAGKSAVGKRLAQRLGRAFIDTDALVEDVAGKSVAAIFADEGEPSFRALERAAIERVAGRPAIVALGGGAIAQPGAVARLAASGTIVYLRARPETLLARIGDARGRPLLAGLDTAGRLARMRELLRARAAQYARSARVVDVDEGDIDAVADRVLQVLGDAAEQQGRAMRAVQVPLGDRSYAIRIGVDILDQAGAAIAESSGARRAVVVTVPEVGRRYGARLERSLRGAGIQSRRVVVADGERSKSLRVVARLYEEMLDFDADRGTAVVALGGGVVGDLAGFLAATFLRGVPFVQVPTTMLAMADASVGGKVAVDLPRGKNLVGAFHQPRLVWMDVATLRSLPRRQRANGLVEVIKHGVIRDGALFARFERDIERVLDLETDPTLDVLERSCQIKAEVVAQDEREADLRMILNFGHTLAHAIETLLGFRKLLHGEAVAIGMVFAARRSEALGLAPTGVADRIESLLQRAGLPTEPPDLPRRAYLDALRVDKKRRDEQVRFIAVRELGKAEIVSLTPAEILPRGGPGTRRR